MDHASRITGATYFEMAVFSHVLISSFNTRYNVIVASKMQAQLKLGCGWARAEPDHSCDPFFLL